MTDVKRGIISSVEGGRCRIKPFGSGDVITCLISMRGAEYKVGEEVVFSFFTDGKGFIFGKMEG